MHIFRQQIFTQAYMEGPENTRRNKTLNVLQDKSHLYLTDQCSWWWCTLEWGVEAVGVSGRTLVHGVINAPELLIFFLHQLQASISLI